MYTRERLIIIVIIRLQLTARWSRIFLRKYTLDFRVYIHSLRTRALRR